MAKKHIGVVLMEAGLITSAQLEEALKIQKDRGGKMVDILISLGHLTPAAFLDLVADASTEAGLDLSGYELRPDLVSAVPKDFAVGQELVPIDKFENVLTVGTAAPLDPSVIEQLETITGFRVKSLLCAAGDVQAAIQRYYGADGRPKEGGGYSKEAVHGLESPMRLQTAARLMREMDSLPALPETVTRVREAMQDPNSSIGDVAEIIMLDPPIAAKILGVANSAAYGFPQRVDDLTLAVSLLGLREAYSLVLSCAVLDVFKKSKHFDYRVFWVESMCCAAASRVVAKASGRRGLFGVFSAGLLHDLGRAALAEVASKIYSKIDQYLAPDEFIATEEQVIGIAHTEAGYALAAYWGLPPEITEPIRFHHRPELATAAKENVAIVALASTMVRATGHTIEENEKIFAGLESSLALLGLDPEISEAMLDEYLERRSDSFREVLGG
jgi:HD-like signal output (HDOD) protein